MSAPDDCSSLLLATVAKLTAAEIPYMISGSYAVVLHGLARATQDVDIVIAPTLPQLERFIAAIEPGHYVSGDAARAAYSRNSLFNVIDTQTGWKVDLIIRKDRPFSLEEFERKRVMSFRGESVYVVTPEDSILTKLEWSKKGGSERQLQDAESVAIVQWEVLDQKYLEHWAAELGISESLDLIMRRARIVLDQRES
jgi:hypothetical protein